MVDSCDYCGRSGRKGTLREVMLGTLMVLCDRCLPRVAGAGHEPAGTGQSSPAVTDYAALYGSCTTGG